jgi:NADPH:quinone reductase-like Zn-dependent oxidoreductase
MPAVLATYPRILTSSLAPGLDAGCEARRSMSRFRATRSQEDRMKAVRIDRFGGPEVVEVQDVPVPEPAADEVLVRVAAAGVALWDAIIREGKSKVSPPPPLTLGSDVAGTVERVGAGVTELRARDVVFGVTNPQFVGAQAEYAVCKANMLALRPRGLSSLDAASAPVIAVTAYQMLFEHANAKRGNRVLITGAAGNVGAYAVQMAMAAGVTVVAVARSNDQPMLRDLGVDTVVASNGPDFERGLPQVDTILDLVGGKTLERCMGALKSGGKLVTVVTPPPAPKRPDVETEFFYADVTTARLRVLAEMFERGTITARVGSVLPLEQARRAHEMLAGAPHLPGKIMLELT